MPLGVVVVCVAALAVLLAASFDFVRNFTRREVSKARMIPYGAPATIPRDLVFQQGKARIELDSQSNTITFVQCHFRNSFWTLRPSPRFTCPVSDVLDVYHQRHESRRSSPSYETRIVTTQGKASIFLPTDAPQDAQLQPIRQALAPVCKGTPSGGFMQSPMFIYVLGFVGGAIGLLAILVYQGLIVK